MGSDWVWFGFDLDTDEHLIAIAAKRRKKSNRFLGRDNRIDKIISCTTKRGRSTKGFFLSRKEAQKTQTRMDTGFLRI